MYIASVSMKDYVKQLVNFPDLTQFTVLSSLYCVLITCNRAAVDQGPYNLLISEISEQKVKPDLDLLSSVCECVHWKGSRC